MTKKKAKKKRVLPVAKHDGMLPLLPLLRIFGSLVVIEQQASQR